MAALFRPLDFLDVTRRRNPKLIKAAFDLYNSGQIHQDTYVLDLDAIRLNSSLVAASAKKAGVQTYFESKQFGRNPLACQEVVNTGMKGAIAIDMEEVRSLHRSGVKVSHIGHLGQIPKGEAKYVLESVKPEVITVYNVEKARQISDAAGRQRSKQRLLLKVIGEDDIAYDTLGGGVYERDVVSVARKINDLPGVSVEGVTSYPGMRYNLKSRQVEPTPNFDTAVRCAERLRKAGLEINQVNAAGMNTASTMKILADHGGTHAEPGQALIGMTPLHAFSDEPEIPGMVYVTEIDHVEGSKAFAYASGFVANVTIGIWNPLVYGYIYALAGHDYDTLMSQRVILEPPVFPGSDPSFFMYLTLRQTPGTKLEVGQTVVAACRGQVYRANSVKVAAVEGIQGGKPRLRGVYDRNGIKLGGPSDSPVP
jgi:predicted amino acid racemase